MGVGISEAGEHLEGEQVLGHSCLRARNGREIHDALHLLLSEIVNLLTFVSLEYSLQAVVRVGRHDPELQRLIHGSFQTLMIVVRSVVADMGLFHPCGLLVSRQRDGALPQPHVPGIDIIDRQLLPTHHATEVSQAVAYRDVSLHRALRYIRRLDILLDPLDHCRRVCVFIRCRRDVPHLSSNLRHVDRPLLLQASVHLALNKPHNRGQPLIQHVSVVRVLIVAHSVTNQTALAHTHACIYIIWFSVNRHANLDWTFITLWCSFSMVIY